VLFERTKEREKEEEEEGVSEAFDSSERKLEGGKKMGGVGWGEREVETYMTCTTAPQPERASRSRALRRVWEMVSKRSSGS